MQKLLVDTTIIVEYLKTGKGVLGSVMDTYTLFIPMVVYTELLAIKRAENDNVSRQIRDFISDNFELIQINSTIAATAGKVLRDYEVTLAHSLIAATALEEDIPLLTYDMHIFDRVANLKLVDI